MYTGTFDCVHWYIRWCTLNTIGGDIRLCTVVHSMVYTGALTIVYTDRMLSNVPSLTTRIPGVGARSRPVANYVADLPGQPMPAV